MRKKSNYNTEKSNNLKLGLIGKKIDILGFQKDFNRMEKVFKGHIDSFLLKDSDTEYDELDYVKAELIKGTIDIAVVEIGMLYDYVDKYGEIGDELLISAILKRRDPRMVLIRSRKNERIPDAKVLVRNNKAKKQLNYLFDNITIYEECKLSNMLNKLSEGNCDGIFIQADYMKAIKKEKFRGFKFSYIDCKECVPYHGQGIYVALTFTNSDNDYTWLSEFSDKNTVLEYDIEERLINKILKYEYVDDADVYAKIEKNSLRVCVYVENGKGYRRFEERGLLKNENLIIRKLVDRIRDNM